MNDRDRERLSALILPVLDGAPLSDADHAEIRRLLAPVAFHWPYEVPRTFPLAREDFPLSHLNEDPTHRFHGA